MRLNHLKYREREFDQTKPSGVYRIAFIGDSFTFGQGISETQRMSNILETELRKQRGNIEVVNFGRARDNTADQVKVLKFDVLPKADPDFVLLQWYVNDVEYKPPQTVTPAGSGEANGASLLNEFKQKMLNVSVLYFLLADAVHWARDRAGMSYEQELFSRVGDPQSKESREAEQAMLEFFRTSKDRKVAVGVVLVPHLAPLTEKPYPFLYLHQRVKALCVKEDIRCVDLLETFSPYLRNGNHASLWVKSSGHAYIEFPTCGFTILKPNRSPYQH